MTVGPGVPVMADRGAAVSFGDGRRPETATQVQVTCLLGGIDHPLPLGTMDEARPICNACTARTVWRADED